ncbi:MAG: hypothetical protein ABII02_00700 [Candidatus Magasanikbacteria bacterium]
MEHAMTTTLPPAPSNGAEPTPDWHLRARLIENDHPVPSQKPEPQLSLVLGILGEDLGTEIPPMPWEQFPRAFWDSESGYAEDAKQIRRHQIMQVLYLQRLVRRYQTENRGHFHPPQDEDSDSPKERINKQRIRKLMRAWLTGEVVNWAKERLLTDDPVWGRRLERRVDAFIEESVRRSQAMTNQGDDR